MEKQIITQKIYEVIKPKIKESDNPLIEDYIPASLLMDLQRDLANLVENLVRQGRSLPDVACGNCKQIEFWYMKIKIQDEWMDGVSGEYNFVKQYCDAITDHDWEIIKVTQYKGDKEEEIESKPSA